jgi:uncharacterized protein (DUF983 family)
VSGDAPMSPDTTNPLRPGVLLWRGATMRCPVCGTRGVVRHWVGLRDRCPRCGFAFERTEGHSIGYIGLNTMVTFALMFFLLVVLLFATYPEPPALPIAITCLVFALLFPLAFLPFSRTLWTAIDLCMTPLEVGEVAPGWELEQYGEG